MPRVLIDSKFCDASTLEQLNITLAGVDLHSQLAWDILTRPTDADVLGAIFIDPQRAPKPAEAQALKNYNKPLILAVSNNDVANEWLNILGIQCGGSQILRYTQHKYHHPREAFLTDGITQEGRELLRYSAAAPDLSGAVARAHDNIFGRVPLVLPYATWLKTGENIYGTVLLNSGGACYPTNAPLVIAMSRSNNISIVVGSSALFQDKWIAAERNREFIAKLSELAFATARCPEFPLMIRYVEPIPSVSSTAFAKNLRVSLQDPTSLPADFSQNLADNLGGFNLNQLADVMNCYRRLGLSYEPISVVPPSLEAPLPKISLAKFPPIPPVPNPPALELFDLDTLFASAPVRLSRLTQHSQQSDVARYILEAGKILKISKPKDGLSAIEILSKVLIELLSFRSEESY